MEPLVENSLNLAEDDIFKPFSLEEFIQQKLKNCILNSDGTYSSNGDVDLSRIGLTKLPVKFKIVKGYFDCGHNKLTALKGAPRKVGGYFYCTHNQLTTLKGAPREVKGAFYCDYNNLTTLEGAPKKVGYSFYCDHNNKLTSLEGAPEEVGREFRCYSNPVPEDELKKTISRSYL